VRLQPSLVNRVIVGKAIGFAIGVVGFIMLPYLWPDAPFSFQLGVLFWYATVGVMIGLLGVWNRHPVLDFPMPWFVRAPLVGAWMNLVLTLFAEETLGRMTAYMFGGSSAFASPYWFVLEGAIVGGLIGWAATRFAGEGGATLGHPEDGPV